MTFLQNAGLSHSEIFGSKVICTYPKLIAAYHVLHRLREPVSYTHLWLERYTENVEVGSSTLPGTTPKRLLRGISAAG